MLESGGHAFGVTPEGCSGMTPAAKASLLRRPGGRRVKASNKRRDEMAKPSQQVSHASPGTDILTPWAFALALLPYMLTNALVSSRALLKREC